MLKESDIAGYFRAGVGACLINDRGQVLVMHRADVPGAWQMPQGGIDAGEQPEQALLREVSEEVGLSAADYQIKASTGWLAYELPRQAWRAKTGRGQAQKWFLCRIDKDAEIKPDQHEFDNYRWVDPDEAIALCADFRKEMYSSIFNSFASR